MTTGQGQHRARDYVLFAIVLIVVLMGAAARAGATPMTQEFAGFGA